jgi:Ca-activated chloride channel family protein
MITWIHEFGLREGLFCGLFICFYLFYLVRTKRLGAYFNSKANKIWIKLGLRAMAFGLLLVALLGPVVGEDRMQVETTGKEVFLVVDLSRSMDATDISPSRISRVKYELQKLLQALKTDKVGLIVFSGQAFVHCPLTVDHSALNLFINTLSTHLMPSATTDIGKALELAREKLAATANDKKNSAAKTIILLTDGEEFGEQAQSAARNLAKDKISLLTLGIGTEKGGRIPTPDGHLRAEEGEVVITKMERESLRNISRQAGGQYFELSNTINQTGPLTVALTQLKGTVSSTEVVNIAANKYLYPLLLALLILTIDSLITLTVIKV